MMRHFHDFSFDPASYELRQKDRTISLQRQPGRVLDLLTREPGVVVTREALRQELWAPGTHVDFDRCINFYVRQVRRALDDSATTPRYVETLPGLGYRFVEVVGNDPGHVTRTARGSRVDRRLLAAACLGLLFGGLAADLVAGSSLDRAAARAVHGALGIEAEDCLIHRFHHWKRGSS